MTNSEFSNFFETFYLQEVNKANRAKFVCHNQDSALRRAEFEHTGIELLSLKPNCTHRAVARGYWGGG